MTSLPPAPGIEPPAPFGWLGFLSSRMRIGRKLALAFMLTAILTGAGIGVTNYKIARESLLDEARNHLMILAQARQAAVADFLETIHRDIGFLATSFWVQDATVEMQTAWAELSGWTRERYIRRRMTAKQLAATLPPDAANETLEQIGMLAALEEVFFKFGPELRGFAQSRGYADVYLVGSNGSILFSGSQRDLLGRNLRDDDLEDTPLAKAFTGALDKHATGQSALVDFTAHADSAPTAYIGSLITGEGRQFLGALILEVPLDRFSEITNRASGLGERGDVVLVGPDGILRSNSRLTPNSTLLVTHVENPLITKALGGKPAVGEIDRVYARPSAPEAVMAALVPLYYGDQRWAVMTSIPLNELLTPVDTMGKLSLVGGGAILSLVLLASLGIAGSITRPIRDITQVMLKLADNDAQAAVPHLQRSDELGWMAGALEIFRRNVIRIAELKDEAEQAARAKAMFLATMSHEIRTPMNGVLSMAALLDQTELDDDQRSMVGVVQQSADALLTVINDILDFSKIEAGKLDIEAIEMSLVETVESVAELLNLRAEDKGLEFVLDIDPATPDRVIGDPTRIRQMLFNLTGNAIKFTDVGTVSIRIFPDTTAVAGETDWLRFEIVDTGIGLTDEQRERLFKPFSQADSTTARRFGGTGLGLSICLGLCDLMGGRIGVDSTYGRGSAFWFSLRLPRSAGADSDYQPSVAQARVLCIGQPRATAQALVRAAQAIGVGEVTMVDTVEAALSRFSNADGALPNVLLVDAAMVGQSVRALLESLREWMGEHQPTMVLTCARGLGSTLLEAERAGYFAALTHPIRRARLHRTVAAALGLVSQDSRSQGNGPLAGAWTAPDPATARAAGAVVLVAEDNQTNQVVLQRILDRCGIVYDFAADGVIALDMLQRHRYGLLLTDFHMPNMDGFALTAAVRTREVLQGPEHPRLPVVALTADALPGTRERCLEAGMDDYLSKPIEIDRLVNVLERYLPAAMALRTPAEPKPVTSRRTAAPRPARHAPAFDSIDPEIFTPERLEETFGGWDEEAQTFLMGFLGRGQELILETQAAFTANDPPAARHAVHALKGSALSVGAVRLGRIAGDVQDLIDAGDTETAPLFADALQPTLDELKAALLPVFDAVEEER